MSSSVTAYKSPFRYVPRHPDHVCAFCGTKIDVKYAYDVDDVKQYPEAAIADEHSVYSCSSCTLRRMYPTEDATFKYEFDLSDPYKYMSTLQRMYSDLDKAKIKFHEKWVYCYGCMAYVPVDNTTEEDGLFTCNACGSVLRGEKLT